MQTSTRTQRKKRQVLTDGPICPTFIADSIAKHQAKTNIGAHHIFLGQVRNDRVGSGNVVAIEYSAYSKMAEKEFEKIREEAFQRFDLICLHMYHSLNVVMAGELCLFVFTSAVHRDTTFQASKFIVERVKTKVPIFGKEIMDDETYRWKENR